MKVAAIKASPAYKLLREKFMALTLRERGIIYAALAVVSFMLLYSVYEPIRAAFHAQSEELLATEEKMKSVGPSIERYVKLKQKRDAIEEEYKEVEFKEGALSHLENLVRNKAGIPSGFTIKDSPPREFGGNYEQTLFSIKLTTTNMPSLIDFLKEVIHGPRPLIVSKIDIQKTKFSDRLEVDVDASSIRRTK